MNKRGKVILVTGASSGFGMHICVELAALGHKVYATMRHTGRSSDLLALARYRKCEKNIKLLTLDVTKPESIRAAVITVVEQDGVIDVLVNNAGFGLGGFFEDVTTEDFRAQFDVNFFGVLNVTREVLPLMRPRRSGQIINISSMSAFSGTPCFSAYCSSKWALEGFSECLFMELAPLGIKVSLVEPGSYRTRIFESNARYGSNFNNPRSPYFESSMRLKELVAKHIQTNTRDPREVALAVVDIVASSAPALRHLIGWHQKMRLACYRLIPFEWYAWLVNKALGR
jgi:NAD(P)-dependent dehydrogenase (short-subunit alcohol dehydrogenase family)